MYQLNKFQTLILNEFKTTKNSIAISASAGSGKTTLLIKLNEVCPGGLFLAFTKASETVLKDRGISNVRTTYSLGMRALSSHFGKLKVDANKPERILTKILESLWFESRWLQINGSNFQSNDETTRELLSFYNVSALNLCTNTDEILPFLEELPYSEPSKELIAKAFMRANEVSFEELTNSGTISFTDMVVIPALMDEIKPTKHKLIFVDEAQDLSKAQRILIRKSLFKNGRIVFVGDRRQAIYGFAGASHNSFDELVELFDAKEMSMPVNYRCSTSVIDYVKELEPTIQAREGAPKGSVNSMEPVDAYEYIKESDVMVLCRTNSYLIRLAISLLRENIPFTFRRGVLQQKLLTFSYVLEKAFKVPYEGMAEKCEEMAEKNPFTSDIWETLKAMNEVLLSNSYASLRRDIKSFFRKCEKKSNITLSTIHAAKGDEADNVVIWGTDLIPHRLSTTPDQLIQETNLDYVARSRARMNLTLVKLR